jgi:hypothetical protein
LLPFKILEKADLRLIPPRKKDKYEVEVVKRPISKYTPREYGEYGTTDKIPWVTA